MTVTPPASCDPWSRQGEGPRADHEAITAVREQLIKACLPETPPAQHRELLRSIALPEAALVRLGSQAHRTDAVEELGTAAGRDFLQAVIPAAAGPLRLGRTELTGGLARIRCSTAEDHDDGAPHVQSIHLAKVRQRWMITAIVTRATHGG